MKEKIKPYIGTKHFYKHVFAIIIPIIIQQLFMSLAAYIDNLMINAYGGFGNYDAYNGVSAANRLMFVLQMMYVGLSATVSIYVSQYYGAKNREKMTASLSLSVIIAVGLALLSFAIIHFFGNNIVDMYLESTTAREYGYRYLSVMKWGMIVYGLNMVLSTGIRTVKQTVFPLVAGVIGICCNTLINYTLIFGNFGFPVLDAKGAAIGTVISRCVELSLLLWHIFYYKKSYFKNLLHFKKIDNHLIKAFMQKGLPQVANEVMWSFGIVIFTYFCTYKNDLWYSAYSYTQNITDLFFVIFSGLGTGVSIVIGSSLGAGAFDDARRDTKLLMGMSMVMGIVISAFMVVLSPFVLILFNPTAEVEKMAMGVIYISALCMMFYIYNSVVFFTLRAGGDTLRAFLLDQGATYLVGIPLAMFFGINAKNLGLTLPILFLITRSADFIKVFVSHKFLKMEKWVVNLTIQHMDNID